MTLAQLAGLVADAATGQAGPAARVLGPVLFAGERGAGARPLAEYIAALDVLEAAIPDAGELAGRLRLVQHPVRHTPLYRNPAAHLAPPAWYGGAARQDVERSAAWELLTYTGYIEVVWPSPVVSVRRQWLVLDPTLFPPWISLNLAGGNPRIHARDLVTWAGDLGRVWAEWHRWRTGIHRAAGNDPEEWAAIEAGIDFATVARPQLLRALPRQLGVEDLYGSVDALHLRALVEAGDTASEALATAYDAGVAPFDRQAILATNSPTLRLIGQGDRAAFLRVVRGGSAWAAAWSAGGGALPAHVRLGLQSPWGQAAVGELADRFAALFRPDLVGTAPTEAWPSGYLTDRPPAAAGPLYNGHDLQFGDRDATRTYAGVVHAADPGGHIARLVDDLRTLGFTAPPAAAAVFDERVRAAVREFQIEASQRWLVATSAGADVRRPPWRRYLGQAHGVVDWETRRALQVWLELPRVVGDRAELPREAGLTAPRNPVRVCATAPTPNAPPAAARAPNAVVANADDLWAHNDHQVAGERVWAFDRLQRAALPATEPNGADPGFVGLDARFASADVHAHRLGRWQPWPGVGNGGPATLPTTDTWLDTRLTWPVFNRALPAATVSLYRVLYGASAVEVGGKVEPLNCYDRTRLSLGLFHWTLFLNEVSPVNIAGELGGFLAYYKDQAPAAFRRDFGAWGLDADPWPTQHDMPGVYVAPVPILGNARPAEVRLDRSVHRPLRNDAAGLGALNWFRSWRSVFRIMTALRTSTALLDNAVRFAQQRLNEVRAVQLDLPNEFVGGTLADVVTSEQGWAALMRYHINMPTLAVQSLAAGGAVAAHVGGELQAAAQAEFAGALPVAPAVAAANAAFQTAVVNNLVAAAPATVDANAAVNAQIPLDGLPAGTAQGLSNAPGTFP